MQTCASLRLPDCTYSTFTSRQLDRHLLDVHLIYYYTNIKRRRLLPGDPLFHRPNQTAQGIFERCACLSVEVALHLFIAAHMLSLSPPTLSLSHTHTLSHSVTHLPCRPPTLRCDLLDRHPQTNQHHDAPMHRRRRDYDNITAIKDPNMPRLPSRHTITGMELVARKSNGNLQRIVRYDGRVAWCVSDQRVIHLVHSHLCLS